MSIPFNKVKTCIDLADTIPYGKYLGLTLARVIQDDCRYIRWMIKNTSDFFISERALKTLEARELVVPTRSYGNHYKYCAPKGTGPTHHADYDMEDTVEWDNIWH